jgi:hypothetical protein
MRGRGGPTVELEPKRLEEERSRRWQRIDTDIGGLGEGGPLASFSFSCCRWFSGAAEVRNRLRDRSIPSGRLELLATSC